MKYLNFKRIIIFATVNLIVICFIIGFENNKLKKNVFLNSNIKGNLFDDYFFNLINNGPANISSSSSQETILFNNFKTIKEDLHEILRLEIENQFVTSEYTYNKTENYQNINLNEFQFNLDSESSIIIYENFETFQIEKYLDQNKILEQIKKYLIDKFNTSKVLIDINIESKQQDIEFYIKKYSLEQNAYFENRLKDLQMQQISINFDKERIDNLIDINEINVNKNLNKNFNIYFEIKKRKIVLSEILEKLFAYLLLINSILFILLKYSRSKM